MKAHVEVASFQLYRPKSASPPSKVVKQQIRKPTSKWPAFSYIDQKPTQPVQLGGQTANESPRRSGRLSYTQTKARLARSARWSNSKSGSPRRSGQLSHIDQNPPSPPSQVVQQRIRKLTSKWPAFIHRSKPAQPAQLGGQTANSEAHVKVASFHIHRPKVIYPPGGQMKIRKLTSKWPAFTISSCLYDHLVIQTVHALVCAF